MSNRKTLFKLIKFNEDLEMVKSEDLIVFKIDKGNLSDTFLSTLCAIFQETYLAFIIKFKIRKFHYQLKF